MKIWIVWLPNVGKSTLFNALTKSYAADAANFPFCTIEPNVGIVDVKDDRLTQLSVVAQTEKIVPATIKFVDIAGIVKGASEGQGLGNKFLSHIREVDAIVQVVRHFAQWDIVHVEGSINPLRDIEIINTELILSDLEQIHSKIEPLAKKAKSWDKEASALVDALKACENALNAEKMINTISDTFTAEQLKLLKPYNLLTAKPFVYAINIGQDELSKAQEIKTHFETQLQKPVAIVCATVEHELMELESEEKEEFLQELAGSTTAHIPTLDDLIRLAFDQVWLMYYFTAGVQECRARAIPKDSSAPLAAGAIHTDFIKKFIKAEIVNCQDFITAGGRSKAKEKGLVRLEGKEYIVQEGDVITFKIGG